MYEAITRDIRVTAEPVFSPERSDEDAGQFVWTYTITIANEGETQVQVMTRHWRIVDAQGRTQEVRGPGVVGQQPIIAPGTSFRYTSACPLTTPSGFMSGDYRCVDENGQSFDIAIPAFSLDSPHQKVQLN